MNRKSKWIEWNQFEKNDIKTQFMLKNGVIGTTLVLWYVFMHHFGSHCLFWGCVKMEMFKYGAFANSGQDI